MQITKEQYGEMVKKASPATKSAATLPMAFVVGGAICAVGEYFYNMWERMGLDRLQSGAWTSVVLIILSALLTGMGLYEKVARHAGAGTLVPITGFANAVVSPALESKTEGFITGVGAKIFTIAGPVILYAAVSSVVYGLVYYFLLK
jgi:stage V sporulation protein AC